LEILDIKQTGMRRGILAKTTNIQFHENSFSISRVVTFRRTDRKEKRKNIIYLFFIPEITQTVAQ